MCQVLHKTSQLQDEDLGGAPAVHLANDYHWP
jgi:hypothetical protein